MNYPSNLVRFLFPSVVCVTNERSMHLTFDDGPHPSSTPKLLKLLSDRRVKATFFLLGERAAEYPKLVSEIRSEGHLAGNHAYSHTRLALRSKSFVTSEIQRAAAFIEGRSQIRTTLFRPPFGAFDFTTLRTARECGYRTVLWSFDSRDFELPSEQTLISRTLRHARNGSILLFHDSAVTADYHQNALGNLLDAVLERGFQFSTIPE